jgi:hypothetical protein
MAGYGMVCAMAGYAMVCAMAGYAMVCAMAGYAMARYAHLVMSLCHYGVVKDALVVHFMPIIFAAMQAVTHASETGWMSAKCVSAKCVSAKCE